MSRDISEAFLVQMNSTTISDPLIWLLTLVSDAGTNRFCANNEPIVSQGRTFTPYAFRVTPPADDTESLPSCSLTIDNVDRAIVDEIRKATVPITGQLELVLASQPDYVEWTIQGFTLRSVTWNQFEIRGTLVSEDLIGQAYPADAFTPSQNPGLF
jgi:hypothetical protein